MEWCQLGRELAVRCPEKFDEILTALRDTVEVHRILEHENWVIDDGEAKSIEAPKA